MRVISVIRVIRVIRVMRVMRVIRVIRVIRMVGVGHAHAQSQHTTRVTRLWTSSRPSSGSIGEILGC